MVRIVREAGYFALVHAKSDKSDNARECIAELPRGRGDEVLGGPAMEGGRDGVAGRQTCLRVAQTSEYALGWPSKLFVVNNSFLNDLCDSS